MSIEITPSVEHSPVITREVKQGARNYVGNFTFDFDAFHDFEIEWTPDYIAYSIDGVELRRREYSKWHPAYDKPSNIVMSLQSLDANSYDGVGFDATSLPTMNEV